MSTPSSDVTGEGKGPNPKEPEQKPADAKGAEPKVHKSLWDTVITSTPVVMTVIATVLAGLSSGEMGRAQYLAATAARLQSKVGDQWNFFQAKRLRDASVENTLRLAQLQGNGTIGFDAGGLGRAADRLVNHLAAAAQEAKQAQGPTERAAGGSDGMPAALSKAHEQAARVRDELGKALTDAETGSSLAMLAKGELPNVEEKPPGSAALAAAMKVIETPVPPATEAELLSKVTDDELSAALQWTSELTAAIDAASKPPANTAVRVGRLLEKLSRAVVSASRAGEDFAANTDATGAEPTTAPAGKKLAALLAAAMTDAHRLSADFTAAQLRYDSARYQRDAAVNRTTATIYEIQARKANLGAERHRTRSGYFFYGMLGAQAAVTLASLALAVKERSIFWSFATALGAGAIAFGGYVYLFK